jgi:hypothetical protein
MLAQFLYRGWRTDLAVRVLERDYRAGNAQAALVLAELFLYDQRLTEAAAAYRAFARAHEEHAAFAHVGLALVSAGRGDEAGARAALRRACRGATGKLAGWCDTARRTIVPTLLRAVRGSG